MINFNQSNGEKDEKIAILKADLTNFKGKSEDYALQLGTLQINHEKIQASLELTKKDYDETVDKLHKMNKARHDLETKLLDEIEKNRSLGELIKLKEDTIMKRSQELEEVDKKSIDFERQVEAVEIKRQGLER